MGGSLSLSLVLNEFASLSVPRERDDMLNEVSAGNMNCATFHSIGRCGKIRCCCKLLHQLFVRRRR